MSTKHNTQEDLQRRNYALDHLPADKAQKVIAESEKLLAFLNEEAVTTHPAVRSITLNIEKALTQLKAEMAADTLIGTGDDTDAWGRAGIKTQ